MALEVILPNSLTGVTNFSGALTDIDEGTTSPDGLWLTTVTQSSSGTAIIGFPSPSTTISGLQEFRLWLRKDAPGGSGTPTLTVDVRQNASIIATAALVATITSDTGELFTFTIDTAVFTSIDGANVDLSVVSLNNGGGPNRRNLDIGAVQWNANLLEATTRRIFHYF